MCSSPILVVRISEIAIKSSKTRRRFTGLLVKHIKATLEILNYKNVQVLDSYSRIYVKGSNLAKIQELLAILIPGIASVSLAYEVETEKEKIKKCIKDRFASTIAQKNNFAVRVKRTGTHDFTSMELAAELGEFILNISKNQDLRVNLTNPQYTLYVEVRDKRSYVFDNIAKGLGGLPACSQGRVLVIYSGLEEDIANVIQLYRRGAEVLPYAIIDDKSRGKIKEDLEELSSFMKLQHYKETRFVKEIEVFSPKEDDSTMEREILKAYLKYKCMAIGISRVLFWKFQKNFPVYIPIFVPHLVLDVDKKQLDKWKEAINYYFSRESLKID